LKKLFLSLFFSFVCLHSFAVSAFETNASVAVVMDYESGVILYEKNASEKTIPSSMTKLMTLYIVFDRLKNNVLKLDDKFIISEKAWRMQGSKMFLRVDEQVSIDELLDGIIIQSGNDACLVIAEGIAGSEEAFAKLMNETAKKIGLTNSNFLNSTGWPDAGHYSSAKDLAILGRELMKEFPEYYHYFSKHEFTYNKIKQKNRNLLLYRNIGVDGMKTGHTEEAGYGVVVSGKRGDARLVVVVNGLSSEIERANEAERLLNYGFSSFEKKTLFKAGQVIDNADVWQGKAKTVAMTVKDDVKLMVPKLSANDVQFEVVYNSPVVAPIKKGDEIGDIIVKIPDTDGYKYKLIATEDVSQAGRVSIFISNIRAYLGF
jgi:D-alanyl-D-alanine carboxypeptidase (penicillin-binding protein 5/6)